MKHIGAVHLGRVNNEGAMDLTTVQQDVAPQPQPRKSIEVLPINSEPPFRCDKCDYSSLRRGNLTKHSASVHGETRTHSCLECEQVFPTKAELVSHVKESYTYDICDNYTIFFLYFGVSYTAPALVDFICVCPPQGVPRQEVQEEGCSDRDK